MRDNILCSPHTLSSPRSTTLITDDLLPQASSSPEVVGSNPTDFKRFLSLPAPYGPLIPFTESIAQ